ncbi:SDR family oxidoreductase [Nocardioides marmoriginsengisoli]|uniref:SDR family oxidoreductase n=1 Tax=Nocardioides marmoriginsengisoli TaxID=661483 RepID=A0A3N0CGJ9_9ACTN|nr:SDR family NAD(P)-dependent oxidoreductase [Nocardioides marmoriginsengisoli]RNL62439.1 SDR family oxidoreductase [Nocardioides marmoriginsengisoli]
MQIEDSTFVVTGGASGLGSATAALLLEQGARVVSTDQRAVETDDPRHLFLEADITDEVTTAAVFDLAISSFGGVDGVVHCAGRGGDRVRILDRDGEPGSLESFSDVIRTNLIGTYNVLRLGAKAMRGNELREGERGAVVLTASVAAFDGQIGQTSYAASKAGVHGMVLVAARDLATHGIRVNAIAPGIFDTPMLARLPETVRGSLAETVPYPKRLGSPREYAALAVQMLSNGYLNGETVRLDGSIRMAPR